MLPVAVLRSVEISGVWAAKEADVPYPKRQHRPMAHRARRRGRRTGCSQAPGCSHWVLKPAPSVRVTKAGVGGAAAMVASVGRAGPATARSRADDQRPPTTRRVLLLARLPPARRALPLAQEVRAPTSGKRQEGFPPLPPAREGLVEGVYSTAAAAGRGAARSASRRKTCSPLSLPRRRRQRPICSREGAHRWPST